MENFNVYTKQLQDIASKRNESYTQYMRHLLLVAATLFGVMASLHKFAIPPAGPVRYIFPLAVLLMSVGIIAAAAALAHPTVTLKHLQKLWAEELAAALRENRKPGPVTQPGIAIFAIAERASYVLLPLSVLLFASCVCLVYWA
jgi:hypothetical protein